jgi:hypothetical protein
MVIETWNDEEGRPITGPKDPEFKAQYDGE